MGSIIAISKALYRAENRIRDRARKALKPMREAKLASIAGGVEPYELKTLEDALYIGMLGAYIYGRAYGYGWLRKIRRKQARRVVFGEELSRDVVRLIVRSDKEILRSLTGVEIDDPMMEYFQPSEEALNFLSNYTVELARVVDEDMMKNMTVWIGDTIREGMSEKEAVEYLAQKARGFSENRLQKIARTEATRAFNIGTLEETRDSEIVVGYKFVAVLDEKTTEICRARHGRFIPKSDEELLLQNTPPLHVNCRSILEPVTEYQELPAQAMPSRWEDERCIPRQREYDRKVLENILRSTLFRKKLTERAIEDVVQMLRDMRIPWRRRYKEDQIRQILKTIDEGNPLGYDFPIRHKELSRASAEYEYKIDPATKRVVAERMTFDERGYTLNAVYHEIIHRQYISRYGGVWEAWEEGVTDYLALYMMTRTHPGKAWEAAYLEPNAKLAVVAMTKGPDEVANLLFTARKNGINIWTDERFKFLWGGPEVSLSDCEEITRYVGAREAEFRKVVSKFYREITRRVGEVGRAEVEMAVKEARELAKNPEALMAGVKTRAKGSWIVVQAVLYMVLNGM